MRHIRPAERRLILSLGKSAGKNTSGSNRFFKQPEKPLRDIELDMIIAGYAGGCDQGKGGFGAIELSMLSVTF